MTFIFRLLAILGCFWMWGIEAKPLNLSVRASSAILINPENGTILFEKDASKPHYPASITKIATALFVLDQKKMDLKTKLTASNLALEILNAKIKQKDPMKYPPYFLEHDGVTFGLCKGETHRLETLMHALLLISSNDVANVIAENCSGSIKQFMDELNSYLQGRGIDQTHFMNPHGLHHPAQLVTAYEMAKIAAWAFQNETFCKIIKKPSFYFLDSVGKERKFSNQNQLLSPGKKYYYPRVIGAKTGYIAKAGHNLVVAAKENGRILIAVLLGCKTFEDCYKDAIALFELAFREKLKERSLFSREFDRFSHEIPEASCALQAQLEQDIDIAFFPAEEQELCAKIAWDIPKLPIARNDLVGNLFVADQRGNHLGSANLFASSALHKSLYYRVIDSIKKYKIAVGLFLFLAVFFLAKRLSTNSFHCS